jgi:hypothetical protein
VHQFVRIGTLALMQGGSAISQDLPPFTVARGDNSLCGLNTVGLRRAGLSAAERLELKRLYQKLFRSGQNLPRRWPRPRRNLFPAPPGICWISSPPASAASAGIAEWPTAKTTLATTGID